MTIERWRDSTPPGFRFAVKLPRSITHEAQLEHVEGEVSEFCDLIACFEKKLGPLLVQLPPSLELDVAVVAPFLAHLARLSPARVVLEPRHTTWFDGKADQLLVEHGMARVGADPACCPAAAQPLGSPAYYRYHGSPRKYFSSYAPEALVGLAASMLAAKRGRGARGEVYCFMDNTGLGAAGVNAMFLQTQLHGMSAARSLGRTPAEPTRRSLTSRRTEASVKGARRHAPLGQFARPK